MFTGIGVSRRDRPPKTEVADAPLHRVPQQSRLADPERRFERAVAAPFGWQLVAICDERARVLLIDQRSRSIVRVWKGYRVSKLMIISDRHLYYTAVLVCSMCIRRGA